MVKQLSLFNQPSLNINRDLKEAMASAVKRSGLSREEVLDQLNQLAERYGVHLMKGNGKGLTMVTFEKWLNPGAREYVPSPNALLVFCGVLEDLDPMRVLMAPLGAKIITDKEVVILEWAKEYQSAKRSKARMRKLEEKI
jgi:hypothetical protein